MCTTPWRVLARLIVLPLFVTPLALGPAAPASATVADAPAPGVGTATEDPATEVSVEERFREIREAVAAREAREAREARREKIRERREARREAARERRAAALATSRGERVVAAAAAQAGTPYVYGGTGPNGFDCSGLTGWAYRAAGVELPRTSDAQAAATTRVSDPQIGDLVFFANGGNVYHVGIYAGDGQIWHSPRPGAVVRKDAIWTSVFYGRV